MQVKLDIQKYTHISKFILLCNNVVYILQQFFATGLLSIKTILIFFYFCHFAGNWLYISDVTYKEIIRFYRMKIRMSNFGPIIMFLQILCDISRLFTISDCLQLASLCNTQIVELRDT